METQGSQPKAGNGLASRKLIGLGEGAKLGKEPRQGILWNQRHWPGYQPSEQNLKDLL